MNNPSERQQNIDLNINYLDKCQTDYPNNLSGERFFLRLLLVYLLLGCHWYGTQER